MLLSLVRGKTINTLRQNHPFLTASLFIFILNHLILSTTQKKSKCYTPKTLKTKNLINVKKTASPSHAIYSG